MPSSLRRREGRLALGANKKIKVYLVEYHTTVGVVAFGFNRSRGVTLKAGKGAERSSSRRKRGRRGLRKGKVRARGCHPRDPPIRQPRPNTDRREPKNRVIRSHLRMCDWHASIRDSFVQRVKDLYENGKFTPPRRRMNFHGSYHGGVNWKKTKARWERLHSHLVRTSSKFLADVALSHRFTPFIENQCGISLKDVPHTMETDASSFSSLLKDLGKNYRTSPQTQVGIECTGVLCTGSICRLCGRRSSRGAPCPGKRHSVPSRSVRDLF